MFENEFEAVSNAAVSKVNYLKRNPIGFFVLSCLAGMYVGFGILLIFSIGGMLTGLPYVKIVMGISFGIALSLVVMAGAELFTGNNMVMASGMAAKKVSVMDTCKLWVVCYLGNWAGSIILAVIFKMAGLATGSVGEFMANAAATKMGLPATELFMRGVLCNILVCLAVWCGTKLKSESAKLIMIFWCLFAFITSGFEHSIANMTLLTVSLLAPFDKAISFSGYFYNLSIVTLGNMVGGIVFVALPYYLAAKKKEV